MTEGQLYHLLYGLFAIQGIGVNAGILIGLKYKDPTTMNIVYLCHFINIGAILWVLGELQ